MTVMRKFEQGYSLEMLGVAGIYITMGKLSQGHILTVF